MANTSSRRVVSRPGVNAEGTGSSFQSPYQPPSSEADFEGDMILMDPTAYTVVFVGDYFWRLKVPGCAALQDLATVAEAQGGAQIHAINAFLQRHLHPEDFALILRRLLNPDDTFNSEHYMDLYRQAVTAGTARPFRQWWASPALPHSAGGSSEPSWLSAAYHHRSQH